MHIEREPVTNENRDTLRVNQPPSITQPEFEDGKEYVVNLKKDVDYDTFWNQMETESTVPNVPNRVVRIINERAVMKRSCHYALTDSEAEELRKDDRISSVEIPPKYRAELEFATHMIQTNNFSKPLSTGTSVGDLVNYGLPRTNSRTNNFIGTVTDSDYNYTLDGEGVDVIIHDTGIEINHPEFLDDEGNSRVQHIDWYIESGRLNPGRIPINLLGDQQFIITSNSYIDFYGDSVTAEFDPFSIHNGLLLGSTHGCMFDIRTGIKQSGRMVQYSYRGGHTTDWQSNGGVVWDVRFYQNNWIEVIVYRHDGAATGTWGLFGNGEMVVDLSAYRGAQLQRNGAVPLSFVLTTDNDGITWEVFGAQERPYHVAVNPITHAFELSEGYSPDMSWASNCNSVLLQQFAINQKVHLYNMQFSFYLFNLWSTPQSDAFYQDTAGHGTHVAGIIAGKTYGWAKKANIYLMKVAGLEGGEGGGIGEPDCFDLITEWHLRKPIDPVTGVRRPTIVNMSWGYSYNAWWVYPSSGTYRGESWSGLIDLTLVGFPSYLRSIPSRVDTVDIAIEEMIDAGIHICIAAGNADFKIDVPGGLDYENTWFQGSDISGYTNRGSSPYSTRALISGCYDVFPRSNTNETKVYFSNTGPGVDFYSAGHSIMSSTSTVNEFGGTGYNPEDYFWNEPGEGWQQCNLSGTSMSSPQTCGYGALVLSANPEATPEELKSFLVNNATDNALFDTGHNDDFGNDKSVRGGSTKMLYNKFNSPNPFKINKE